MIADCPYNKVNIEIQNLYKNNILAQKLYAR